MCFTLIFSAIKSKKMRGKKTAIVYSSNIHMYCIYIKQDCVMYILLFKVMSIKPNVYFVCKVATLNRVILTQQKSKL